MKVCPGCKEEKPPEMFAINTSRHDGLQTYCRACKSRQDHKYYSQNREAHYQRIKRLLQENREKLWEYLKEHPCVDCGESNPIVLEFDHVRPGKIGSISYLLSNLRYSWGTLQKEIQKCEVRCANCHRIKTYKQLSWYTPLGV